MREADSRDSDRDDIAPGDKPKTEPGIWPSARIYLIGFLLSLALTMAAFASVHSPWIWAPGIPVLLLVLAVAQMGVHLVFFLHIGSGPDSTNNVLALAFGTLIVGLILGGSMWIMSQLNTRHMLPDPLPSPATGAVEHR